MRPDKKRWEIKQMIEIQHKREDKRKLDLIFHLDDFLVLYT
jgi:hypothetical protein